MKNVLMWFRADLRSRDNRALSAACDAAHASGGGVVGLFIICPGQWLEHDWAGVKVEFILRTLGVLSAKLGALGIPLLIEDCDRFSDAARVVADAARENGCGAVHWNAEYEVNEARRDDAVSETLTKAGIDHESHDDQTILPPGSVRTGEGKFFTVFKPFKRAWLKRVEALGGVAGLQVGGRARKQGPPKIGSSDVPWAVKGLSTTIPAEFWPAGEAAAEKRLSRFIEGSIARYRDQRNIPSIDGTSVLSPYLAVGSISARRCVQAAAEANGGLLEGGIEGIATWISEVVWREFYRNIIVAFPRVVMGRAFKGATERLRWRDDDAGFAAWCAGRTGVPIVDAGMRQLLGMGWMHNRVRMITAMYLTKDLFIDWRRGERHFMRHLIDGDLAQNNGGWQWSASTGTDAAPYFRVFNPITQSRKFDAEGEYIRRWVPELAKVEGDAVHEPYGEDGLSALPRAGLSYPEPIVDHRRARERVMEQFKKIKRSGERKASSESRRGARRADAG